MALITLKNLARNASAHWQFGKSGGESTTGHKGAADFLPLRHVLTFAITRTAMQLLKPFRSALILTAIVSLSSTGPGAQNLSAREWTDASGTYKFDGDLIAASDETIVLRRKAGELEAYRTEQLSESDRTFLKEHLESQKENKPPEEMQTWTGREGLKFRGRVIGYGSKPVVLSHARGKTQINGKSIEELDQLYQFMVPKIVAEYDDKSVMTINDLGLWGRKLRGKEKSFNIDGVMMILENGEKVAAPLFLFSSEERALLEQGWENWNAESTHEAEKKREEFLTQTAAQEYQKSLAQQAQVNQRIQIMQLEMLAVNSGIVQVWEVQLIPLAGVAARSFSVVVPAQNSLTARMLAEQKYPGFGSAAVRQLNYR